MNCRNVRRLLVEFLEGTLAPRAAERIAAHLQKCGRCRKERDILAQSWQMLDAYTAPQAPADFTASLMRRIRSEQADYIKVRVPRPWFGVPRLIPQLALVLMLAVGIVLYGKKPQTTMVAQQPAAVLTTDTDIIQNLDVLEDAGLWQNIDIAQDLDALESFDEGKV